MKLKNSVPIIMSAAMIFVGLVHFLTAITPLFNQLNGVTGHFFSEYSHYFSLTGTKKVSDIVSLFLGVILIGLGIGLYHRKKRAWNWAFFVLIVALANSFYGQMEIQNLIVSGVYLLFLILFKRRFNVESANRMTYSQIIAWLSVVFAVGYGAIGSYLLRAQFTGIHNWIDAVYYTLVTYSTLGYGDATPQTMDAKVFVISMILIGVSTFVAAITMLIGPMVENRIKGVLSIVNKLRNLSNHVIICGHNSMSHYAGQLIKEQDDTVLYILKDKTSQPQLEEAGFHVLIGDATMQETLENANLSKSKTIIAAFESDADNILTVMTAEAIRHASGRDDLFRIITRIDQKQNIDKARRIGADKIISPAILGGKQMAKG